MTTAIDYAKLERIANEKGSDNLKGELAYWTEYEPEGDEGDDDDGGYSFADAWERVHDSVVTMASEKPGCVCGKVNEWGPDKATIDAARKLHREMSRLEAEAM